MEREGRKDHKEAKVMVSKELEDKKREHFMKTMSIKPSRSSKQSSENGFKNNETSDFSNLTVRSELNLSVGLLFDNGGNEPGGGNGANNDK